jgi:hypothetical protein
VESTKSWFIAPRLGVHRVVIEEDESEVGRRMEAAAGVRYRELELSGYYAYTQVAGDTLSEKRSWVGGRLVIYPSPWVFAGVGFTHNWNHAQDPPQERNGYELVGGFVLVRGSTGKIDLQMTYGRFERTPERMTSFDHFPAVHVTHFAVMLGAQI